MRRGGLVFIAGIAASLLLLTAGLTGVIRLTAGDRTLMEREMLRYAPPAETLLPEGEYGGVAAMITGYLTGDVQDFGYRFTDEAGIMYECFHDYEAAHMADCRALIRPAAGVCICCLAAAAVLLAAALYGAGADRRIRFADGMLAGCCAFGILTAVLTVWGLADFSSLFLAFHRAAFRNDLWLLNPATDLLIRLMPVRFFTALILRGLVCFLVWAALILVLTRMLRGRKTHEV